ncbi:MAG: hypothetical protein V2J24_17690 [Pseudomonadales bacterium]|nr:hypothetical protein [Pseudomonadales bacterium]
MLEQRIVPLMLVVGSASAAGLLVALAPEVVLGLLLDWAPADAFGEVIVRSWGSLVGLLGLGLLYGARHEGSRRLALLLSCAGKATFLGTLLILTPELLRPLGPVVLFDGLAVVLFAIYLLRTHADDAERPPPAV